MASPTYAQRRAFYKDPGIHTLKSKEDSDGVRVVVGEVEGSDVPGREEDFPSSGPLILKSYSSL